MEKQSFVYIMTNKPGGVLYTGLATNLVQRVEHHRKGLVKGFTKKYNIKTLVYYEIFDDINEAALREKRIKGWKREWKENLIKKANPNWFDLYEDLLKKVA